MGSQHYFSKLFVFHYFMTSWSVSLPKEKKGKYRGYPFSYVTSNTPKMCLYENFYHLFINLFILLKSFVLSKVISDTYSHTNINLYTVFMLRWWLKLVFTADDGLIFRILSCQTIERLLFYTLQCKKIKSLLTHVLKAKISCFHETSLSLFYTFYTNYSSKSKEHLMHFFERGLSPRKKKLLIIDWGLEARKTSASCNCDNSFFYS